MRKYQAYKISIDIRNCIKRVALCAEKIILILQPSLSIEENDALQQSAAIIGGATNQLTT